MFRSMNSEEHFCERTSGPRGAASMAVGDDGSARSWISILAAVSRPAWSLLQKYLPWTSKAAKSNIDFGHQLMAGLDNLMPSEHSSTHPQAASVHCHHENGGIFTSGDVEPLNWLTGNSLREFGIEDTTGNASPVEHRYLASTRKLFSQFLAPRDGKSNEPTQNNNESTPNNLSVWCPNPATRSSNTRWLQGLWRFDSPQSKLPTLYRTRTCTNVETKSLHCEDYHSSAHCVPDCHKSAVRADNPVEAFEHCDEDEWTGSERAGCSHVKQSTDCTSLHKPGLEFLQNSDRLLPDHEGSIVEYQLGKKSAATCSEVAVLTPDQDNGYSSLEEESANARQCNMNTVCESFESDNSAASQAGTHGHGGQQDKSAENTPCKSVKNKEDEAEEEEKALCAETVIIHEVLPVKSTPYCQNKAIAFIMGSPCSDESDTEDNSVQDSDDDDGFDSDDLDNYSESEDLEDSDDEDEEEDEGGSESDEFDSESERLWNSLCQSRDPYNPRNFTAPIRTLQKSSVSAATFLSPAGFPTEPSSLSCSSPSLSPLLGGNQREVESSEEACSSMDEAESLKLWNSFSCSSDPYSPLNFQAAIRTRQPARQCCKKETPIEPLLYRKEEAEERMDSGFSEAATVQGFGSAGVVRLKKVTFIEEVEEFYASSDEERRGPWEEYARDRCRFQRRVQEVEESISYCLSPSFRLHAFQRLHVSS